MPPEHLPGAGWSTPPGGWPAAVWTVPYDLNSGPGTDQPPSWLHGSNCQRYAYEILRLFGRDCPPLRSSELWNDHTATAAVTEPLDLVLFNATADPFGAHVGIWMATDSVLHLNHEIGHPTNWPLSKFADRPRYSTLIGFKRVLTTT